MSSTLLSLKVCTLWNNSIVIKYILHAVIFCKDVFFHVGSREVGLNRLDMPGTNLHSHAGYVYFPVNEYLTIYRDCGII